MFSQHELDAFSAQEFARTTILLPDTLADSSLSVSSRRISAAGSQAVFHKMRSNLRRLSFSQAASMHGANFTLTSAVSRNCNRARVRSSFSIYRMRGILSLRRLGI